MCQVKNTNFLLQSDHGDKRFTCAFYKPKKSEEKGIPELVKATGNVR